MVAQAATDPQAAAELEDRFRATLQFGTAGLRGAMAPGPNRMNRAVVSKAAAGLGAFLLDALPGQKPRVVVGYDGRHHSQAFAEDTAAIMTAQGIEVMLMPRLLPTPLCAFGVRHLPADAGVMVTASHNPAADNGYKVYLGGRVVTDWGQGSQIVPPYDQSIAAEIAQVGAANTIPRATEGWTVLGENVVDHYIAAVLGNRDGAPRNLRIVTTSLHGVGGQVLSRMLEEAGFTDVHPVPEQYKPDADFPTVVFPNPEEKGAIDMALALAQQVQADVVIANDPDADRCAMAVFDPRLGDDGAWRMLHGDETGSLLGFEVAQRCAAEGASESAVLANSIVSSRLLARIAAGAGLGYAKTLTGFKWISRTPGLVFGYEEALGYCVDPANVRDKDGISAALIIAQLANRLKAEGRTIIDCLDDLARQHGLFLSDQLSARFSDLSLIPATMARLRANPPATLVGSPVVEMVDLAEGWDGLPGTDGMLLRAQDDTRVIIRPSGTEPKVKCYLEAVVPVEQDADFDTVTAARACAREVLEALKPELTAVLGL
ncbi:MAG: phospho-sugar mutase [Cellulomonadaceae bacterium]|nr:phospho-sugar mutase [Cellulomonadaceae bacterium]